MLLALFVADTLTQREKVEQIKAEATGFITSLAEGRIEEAMALSAGDVLENIKRHQNYAPPAGAVLAELDIRAEVIGSGWALLNVKTEVKSGQGLIDVQWHRVHLIKKDGKWKVHHMERAMPLIRGSFLDRFVVAGQKEIKMAQSVFQRYLKHMAANEYKEAGWFLAGPAADAHRAAEPVLSRSPLLSQVGDIEFETKWATDSFVALRADYQADGRDVSVIVTFYKTSAGWRILSVKQI